MSRNLIPNARERAVVRRWHLLFSSSFCLLFALATTTVAASTLRLGVLGDSISAGDGSDFGSKPNWVAQIKSSGAFVVGSQANQAVGGSVSDDVVFNQLPAIQNQIRAGQLDYTVVLIGANDAAYAALDYLGDGDLSGAINNLVTKVVGNIIYTLEEIAATGPVHQIVANIPDQTVAPQVKSLFTQYHATAAQIAEVRAGIQQANAQIAAYALSHGIPVLDLFTATDNIIAHPPLTLAGVRYTNLFAADGYHPGAVSHGLIAEMVISAANRQYGAGVAKISDQQIVRNTGRTPTVVGPTYYNVDPYVILATPVPEPSTILLGAIGGVAFVLWQIKRQTTRARR